MLNSKSIVIKNHFINKNSTSFGSSPAKFVTNYMARNDATLTTYPVNDTDYAHMDMLSKNSVFNKQSDKLMHRRITFDSKRPTDKDWFDLTTLEGRAFDNNVTSLSKKGIKTRAQEMQNAFDQGHTVLTIVTSFDNNYLKDMGVETRDTPNNKHFHTNVDEMKLRMAVQAGCKSLGDSLNWKRPLYIGSIQLDRDHPHAHIAMCNTGSLHDPDVRYMPDGTEYGYINKTARHNMREAIDDRLDYMRDLHFVPSNQVEQTQNLQKNFAKNYAILPEQKKLILAKSLDKSDPLEEELIDSLSRSMGKVTNKSKDKIRQSLKTHLDKDAKAKDTNFKLPPLIALQTLKSADLRRSNKKLDRMVGRMKKAHKDEQAAKDQEQKLADLYVQLRIMSQENPKNEKLIKNKVLPYYNFKLLQTATKLDKARLYQFQPTKDTPESAKTTYKNLQEDKKASQTEFDKETLLKKVHQTVVNWHKNKLLTNSDIAHVLHDDGKGSVYIPEPDRQKLNYLKLSDPEFNTNQTELNNLQKGLARDAKKAIDQIPKTKENEQLLRDVNADLAPDIQNIPQPKPKEKEIEIPKEEKEKTSISYKDADDVLLDSLEF